MNTFLNALTGCLVSLALTTPVLAQTTTETDSAEDSSTSTQAPRIANGQRFGSWAVTCEAIAVNETACVLTQRLVRSAGNSFLAEMLAFWSADRSKAYIAARVPNGVYLPSGFVMQVDGSEDRMEFVWQSCSPDLCEALFEIDLETIEALSNGSEMLAGYRPNLQADAVVFKMGMDGLNEGLTSLK